MIMMKFLHLEMICHCLVIVIKLPRLQICLNPYYLFHSTHYLT